MNLADLKAPFTPKKISWRLGSTNGDKTKGMALAYIDARDVQDRLDEVCGLDGWQCRYIPMHDKKTVCEIGILVTRRHGTPDGLGRAYEAEWVWKADGAGDSDVEAEKGALSDAFKRAAVKWGIGRYLYDLDSPWVAIEAAGRSFKIAGHEYARLEGLLARKPPKQPTAFSTITVPAGTYDSAGKVQQPPKPKTTTPKQWGQDALATIRALSGAEVTDWLEKNGAALVKLRHSEPVLHTDILALVQQRQALAHG